MQTFLNFDLSNSRNYQPKVAIRNSVQTYTFLTHIKFTAYRVPNASKMNKVINLKQTIKVAHIIHM